MRTLTALGAVALLAACGGGGSGSTSETGTSASGGASAPAAAVLSGKDVLNACAKLDNSKVEQILGGKLESAKLDAVHDGSQNEDLYSQCIYSFGGMNMVIFGTGQSSDGASEPVAKTSERIRDQLKQASDKPAEDVPGVGKAAMWSPELHALYVFTGGGRFMSFTMSQMGQPDPKAAAVKLAQAAGA